ncbi:MAG: PepSY-associated TM helix domain-containing protein [Acidobacteriota bacterium]|nr:MAG: PepSY-associated TM helix domain-containing protein [Acidobacteriota bacterium]
MKRGSGLGVDRHRNRSERYFARLNKWTRKLHIFAGLFVSPFILLYAVSAILFNHTWAPGSSPLAARWERSDIEIPSDLADLDLARAILSQLGITGEIEFFRQEENATQLVIPVMKPRRRTIVRVDVARRAASVEERDLSFWAAILYLHKSPGPHLAGFRGNWFYTTMWRWLADASICLILFLSTSGVYLWSLLKAKRRAGLVTLVCGAVTIVSAITLLVR